MTDENGQSLLMGSKVFGFYNELPEVDVSKIVLGMSLNSLHLLLFQHPFLTAIFFPYQRKPLSQIKSHLRST